jgi:hypothetical protein
MTFMTYTTRPEMDAFAAQLCCKDRANSVDLSERQCRAEPKASLGTRRTKVPNILVFEKVRLLS